MFTQRRVALRFRSTTFRMRGRVATAKVTFSNKSAPVLCKRNAVLLLFCAVFRPIRSSVNVVLDLRFRAPDALTRHLTNGHMHVFHSYSLFRALSNPCVPVNTLSLSRDDIVISRSGSPHDASHLPSIYRYMSVANLKGIGRSPSILVWNMLVFL